MGAALVLDSDNRPGLCAVRSLGRQGVRVIAGSAEPSSMGFRSRFAGETVLYPHPTDDPDGFLSTIVRVIEENAVEVVLPASDMTMAALVRAEESLRPLCAVALPARQSVEAVLDKRRTLEIAESLGIPCPRTFFPASKAELEKAAGEVELPVVLKPVTKTTTDARRGLDFKALVVESRAELAGIVAGIPDDRSMPMVQEFRQGLGVGIETLLWDDEPVVLFQHQRLREKNGVSVLSVSRPRHEELTRRALSLLRALAWRGPAMVEFRSSRADFSDAVLMEINGRMWGSIELAVACGIDFPYLSYRCFADGKPPPVPSGYDVGVWRHWPVGDLVGVFGGNRLIERRSDAIPLGRGLLNFLRSCSPSIGQDVWDLGDPGPGLRELLNHARKVFGR